MIPIFARTKRLLSSIRVLACVFLALRMAMPASLSAELTSCGQVHALSVAEAAQAQPVRIEAVVTFFDWRTNSTLMLQDATGAVYVDTHGVPFGGKPGDRVEIRGATGPGGFAPIVQLATYRILGPGILPDPVAVGVEDLRLGFQNCQRVTFRGRVRAASFGAQFHPPRLVLEFQDQDTVVHAHLIEWQPLTPEALVDAEVEITGVAAGTFNQRRQLLRPMIYLQDSSGLRVIQPPRPLTEVPLSTIGELFTYRGAQGGDDRVRLRAVVLGGSSPDWLALADASGAVLVRPAPFPDLEAGDEVMVSGYPALRDLRPYLTSARIEMVGRTALPAAQPFGEFKKASSLDGWRVRAEGELAEPPAVLNGLVRLRLAVPGGMLLVEAPAMGPVPPGWQPGARLAAVGVCRAEFSPEAMAHRFPEPDRVALSAAGIGGITLLSRAPWWTPRRLAYAISALVALLGVSGLGLWRLRGTTLHLTARGRELAQAELLRTTQLHEQMAAQHEQQLAFQAVLGERQRLSQELHDSMEQQFASLSLRIEAAAGEKAKGGEPSRLLAGARAMIEESRGELRRCIWGLRARALEQGTIGTALAELARQHNEGAGPRLNFAESGAPQALAAAMENHLFRFAQEAIANALKHARATHISIHLDWAPENLRLQIEDDGRGLPADAPEPAGRLGLAGLRQRGTTLGGTVAVTARPGGGLRAVLEVPLAGSPSVASI